MFDINFKYNNITFASIEKKDIEHIKDWINSEEYYYGDVGRKLELAELYEMFLEYYIGECEFFIKIEDNGKIIGICRGRIEFLDFNKVWLGCFIVDKKYNDGGNKNIILEKILDYFKKNYGIGSFETGIIKENKNILQMWKQNGFKVLRISKEFYNINGHKKDMLVLRNNI